MNCRSLPWTGNQGSLPRGSQTGDALGKALASVSTLNPDPVKPCDRVASCSTSTQLHSIDKKKKSQYALQGEVNLACTLTSCVFKAGLAGAGVLWACCHSKMSAIDEFGLGL